MSASWIEFAGYQRCACLENGKTRVVLGPHCGGRVLEYAWQGQSALMLDPRDNGRTYARGGAPSRPSFPSGGRFDIGPEHIAPPHPSLWLGPWEAQIVNDATVRLTSGESAECGTRLVREFTLAPDSSHLRSTQIVRNISSHDTRWCHWGRTFRKGHGICVVPLTPELSRFPKEYVMYGPGSVIDFAPDDPAIRRRDGFLEVLDTPARPKLGIDSYAGWFGYLMPHDLLFVKRFPTWPDRVYNEVAGLTISLWYYENLVCELEPIGPMEVLAPGESSSFTEEWWLLPFKFPEDRGALDLGRVAEVARGAMG